MNFRNIALATAAVSLAASPAIAEAAFERSSAPVEGENSVGGGTEGVLLSVLAGAAVIAGIIVIADDDDDDAVSP